MYLGLFSIPWTIAGLIYPPAAALARSRRHAVGCGVATLVCCLALARAISTPAVEGAESSNLVETTVTVVWLALCVGWPLYAVAVWFRSRQVGAAIQTQTAELQPPNPQPAQPLADEKPAPLNAAQRKALKLPAAAVSPTSPPGKSRSSGPAADVSVFGLSLDLDDVEDDFSHLHPDTVQPKVVAFLYENGQGELSSREVTVDHVGTLHFAGLCHRERASRTFRFDRIQGHATLVESGEQVGPRLLRNRLRGFGEQELRRQRRAAAKVGHEILFTGFKAAHRAELEVAAESAGMTVRKRVTQNLDFLVAGPNVGPSKLHDATAQGVMVLDVEQFTRLVQTGEMPDR